MFLHPVDYGRKAEELLWRKVYYEVIQLIKTNKKVRGDPRSWEEICLKRRSYGRKRQLGMWARAWLEMGALRKRCRKGGRALGRIRIGEGGSPIPDL